jgi:hypothetical protein
VLQVQEARFFFLKGLYITPTARAAERVSALSLTPWRQKTEKTRQVLQGLESGLQLKCNKAFTHCPTRGQLIKTRSTHPSTLDPQGSTLRLAAQGLSHAAHPPVQRFPPWRVRQRSLAPSPLTSPRPLARARGTSSDVKLSQVGPLACAHGTLPTETRVCHLRAAHPPERPDPDPRRALVACCGDATPPSVKRMLSQP